MVNQFMTPSEMVEATHKSKGEPTYAELKEQRDKLLEALEDLVAECTVATDSENFVFWMAQDAIDKARAA